jgi:DNA-binding GntR family transcriptional regulator
MAKNYFAGYITMPTTMEHSFTDIRGRVARILLERADGASGGPRLAQRDIAATVGTDWGMVHISLKSMQAEGAIKIDRNRLIINKERLRKVAGIKA